MRNLGRATWAAAAAFLVAAFVTIHEWAYHQGHRYTSGPSLEIAALAAAVAVLAAVMVWTLTQQEHRRTHE